MTTTNPAYNPLLSALRELTTPDARRWYLQQAKATAALAQTIALRSIAVVQPLLKPTSAIPRKTEAMQVVEAIAQPEPIPALDAEVDASAIAEDEIPTLLRFSGGDAEDERPDSVDDEEDTSFYGAEDELEDAMQVPAGWNAIEADDDADSGFNAIADSDEELDQDAA
jgi:hypothetical protein